MEAAASKQQVGAFGAKRAAHLGTIIKREAPCTLSFKGALPLERGFEKEDSIDK